MYLVWVYLCGEEECVFKSVTQPSRQCRTGLSKKKRRICGLGCCVGYIGISVFWAEREEMKESLRSYRRLENLGPQTPVHAARGSCNQTCCTLTADLRRKKRKRKEKKKKQRGREEKRKEKEKNPGKNRTRTRARARAGSVPT